MDCWPLGLLDRGKKNVLEEGDRIQVREVVRDGKGGEKCVTSLARPKDYFSGNAGDRSPMDRLKDLVEAEPEVRTVNPVFLRYLFDQQRIWLRKNVGH
jgi:hypothetical protein